MFKKIMRVVLSKTFAFAVLALIQIGVFVFLLHYFTNTGTAAYMFITVVTVLVLVAVLEQDDLNPAYKLMWMLIIVLMPVSGMLFYLLWGHRHVPRRRRRQLLEIEKRASKALKQDKAVLKELEKENKRHGQAAHYLWKYAGAPVYYAEDTEYYHVGEEFFPRFLEAIKNAKKFIFMEYYIYEEGYMLNTAVDILRKKAAEGVDVRILYDGFGSLLTLPPGYGKKLQSYGIKACAVSPLEFTVHVSDYAMLNHRDHRKLTVVDGEIAFSGGINFADEYINVKKRFGEWKDTAFMLKGQAVHSLSVTFLRMWDFANCVESDFESFRAVHATNAKPEKCKSFVQPYSDSPLDSENVSENAYLNVIRHATEYVYISTPYLILDHEMITALTLAAKSGVDVRILTPGIPDKPLVFWVTQSYYPALLKGGVKIFEYTPGFNHAKMYVSDDSVAIVGSANMDYRSLYLHFENCVSFYGGQTVQEAKEDMQASFSRSYEITLEETKRMPLYKRIVQIIVRFFAPMM